MTALRIAVCAAALAAASAVAAQSSIDEYIARDSQLQHQINTLEHERAKVRALAIVEAKIGGWQAADPDFPKKDAMITAALPSLLRGVHPDHWPQMIEGLYNAINSAWFCTDQRM